jgi:hypothetical protein
MKTAIDIDAITQAGHDEDNAGYIRALCEHLECEPDDLKEARYDTYGLTTFDHGSQSYAIGTDEEAGAACLEYIKDSVWAFNSSFICEQCDLPWELVECLSDFQQSKCEGANDALLALVEKCTTLEEFTAAAVRADGRGHFLNGYDGNEDEIYAIDQNDEKQTYYIYRTN